MSSLFPKGFKLSEFLNLISILKVSKNWNDIFNSLKQASNSGKIFEEFCKYFYLAEPSIKNDFRNVWLFTEVPLDIKDKLNLAQIDHGVDLVLEGQTGEYSVVQCKFRGNQNSSISWTKDKIANLFAEGNKANNLIVFTNASGLDKHSLKKGADKFKITTLGDLLEISTETIQNMLSKAEGKKENNFVKYLPRPYQEQAIKSIVSGFHNFDRGQLILPCGAGKTLVALWAKEAMKPKKTLVLVPSLALLRQIKQEWNSHQKFWTKYICVCSELDITKDDKIDAPAVHTYEINGQVTTDPNNIFNFLNNDEEAIVYSTYQSLEVVIKAIEGKNLFFDLSICDEAHKTAGSKLEGFALIHDNQKLTIKKRLYMTATPRIFSDEVKSKLNEEDIKYLADMSDESKFGPEFFRMSFKEAILRDILVDYQIIAIGINDEDLRNKILTREYVNAKETIEDVANNFSLDRAMKKHEAKHAITFHSSINRAKDFMNRHKEYFPKIAINHVSGEQTTNKRNVIINEFKNSSKAIITNARCLTEGVDIPVVDMVFFSDPKYSKIDIVQASGRALRKAKHKNKKLGYIVVPLYHNKENDIEEIIKSSSFKKIISVVRAMCDQDERLRTEINEIIIRKGKKKLGSQHIKVETDKLPLLSLENFKHSLKNKIFEQIIRKSFDPWEMKFELLKKYHNEFHKWPNGTTEYKSINLGSWCNDQRNKYRFGTLSSDRVINLTAIGFNLKTPTWDDRFEQLKKYKLLNPSSWPKNAEYFEDFNVGSWCAKERQMYRLGIIKTEKREKLDSIQFPMSIKRFDTWETKYERLKIFRAHFSSRWPYPQEKVENTLLFPWCSIQRRDYQQGKLSEEKISKLEIIGFPWDDPTWEQYLKLFSEFKNNNPLDWPPFEKDQNGVNLRAWCMNQGFLFKNKQLPDEKVKMLNSINFDFDGVKNLKQGWDRKKREKWDEMFNCLVKFREINPNSWPLGKMLFEGKEIGKWCGSQRAQKKQELIPQEVSKKLDNINFHWEIKTELNLDLSWNNNYELLKEFRIRFNKRWPSAKEMFKGFNLGNWCVSQRTKNKQNKLLKKRKILLEKIGFSWENPAWDANYELLIKYHEKYPNKWPRPTDTFDGYELGRWLALQKGLYWKGKLTKPKLEKLESLNLFKL